MLPSVRKTRASDRRMKKDCDKRMIRMTWIGVGAGVFLLDNRIKAWVEKNLKDDLVKEVAKDHILLRKFHNQGMALGAGENYPEVVKVVTACFWTVLAVGYIHLLSGKESVLTKLGGALALGGGACNLVDRLRRGYVTDYFSFNVPWKKLRGLVFNLSDLFIFVGALLAAIGIYRRK